MAESMSGIQANTARIPSLDGARAVSILLVVYWHLETFGAAPMVDHLWRFQPGNLGVRIFFVISGFIITTLLIEEHQKNSSISLVQFYIRRCFRILPAYWLFLAAVGVAIPFAKADASYADVGKALVYLTNYQTTQLTVGHTWSLAVEEQFYLLWPVAIALVSWRSAKVFAVATLIISPLARVANDLGWWPGNPNYAFEMVCDALASGCLLAIFRENLWARVTYRRLIGSHTFLVIPAAALGLQALNLPLTLWHAVGITILNTAIALTLDWLMRMPDSPLGRILNSRPMIMIGMLSYSIYLWQQFWLGPVWEMAWYFRLILIALCAVTSYWLVESPLRRLGGRLARSFGAARSAAASTV